ncbi:hypothetical protein [Zavarzinia compransoris]|uniref:Uncharacterized protein n=1 Tax=Zavarzinia compransoris TaxID=1264899 RepID=A0A317E0V0_9PROT|nr:hypothetical protein [Zavarzinia compransoris]PWR18993.1 hypothetical protein DKG75_18675 [Zavarzinia compransoris]TDP48995.1 hypothetical protein DES42_101356 [Zavarzinia compransoris]
MTIDDIVKQRAAALLHTFRYDWPPSVEAEDVRALDKLTFFPDAFGPGAVSGQLDRRSIANVVIMAGSDRPHDASLWVRASYRDYRGAYIAFLKKIYGLTVTPQDLAPYDVDHLLNRARAGGGGKTMLRIEAVRRSTNRQWGALIEKLAASDKIAGNRRTSRLMSYLIAGKVADCAPPAGLDDRAGREQLAVALSSRGLNPDEVRKGLDNMLGHIARNQT